MATAALAAGLPGASMAVQGLLQRVVSDVPAFWRPWDGPAGEARPAGLADPLAPGVAVRRARAQLAACAPAV
jgi:hypothetical protein